MTEDKCEISKFPQCTDSASTLSNDTSQEESLATDSFRLEGEEIDVQSYTLAIANYLYVKHEEFQQEALRRFKGLMKVLWKSIDGVKSNAKVYANAFIKFEKQHRSIPRNEVKFIFDRLIDSMACQQYPHNMFDLKNAIGNQTFNRIQFTPAFFASPGIKEMYKLHHELAAISGFYFQLNLFQGRILTRDEKSKIIEYCGLVTKLTL